MDVAEVLKGATKVLYGTSVGPIGVPGLVQGI